MEPRIPPLDPHELDDDQRALVGSVNTSGTDGTNVLCTLVRHRELFRQFVPYASKLLHGNIDPRVRELIACRIAYRCDSPYEWLKHEELGRKAGFDDTDIAALRDPQGAHPDVLGALIIRLVDELHDDAHVSDATWAALAERYGEQDLVELVFLVGHLHLVAYVLNALQVQAEVPREPAGVNAAS